MRTLTLIVICFLMLAGCSGESGDSSEPGDADSSQGASSQTATAEQPENPPTSQAPEPEPSMMATPSHSSRMALDWAGTYSGVVPCDGCPGIQVEVTLNEDGTFERSTLDLDRPPAPITDSGSFTWNDAGSIVTLRPDDGESQAYQVGEHQLFQLNARGERIEGELANSYVLKQHIYDPEIEGRRWRLTELNGQAVESDDLQSGPFLFLDGEESRAYGNASCNTFNTSYTVKIGQRIQFDDRIVTTRMACPDMGVEEKFMSTLAVADSYSIGEDGSMTLNRARMAPLARFVEESGAD